MAEYFSVIWIDFIRCFGFILFGNMDFSEILNGLKPNYAEILKGKPI